MYMYRCVPVQGMKMPHPKDLTQNKHVAPRKTNEGLTTFVVRQRHANPRILGEIPPSFGQMLELSVMSLAHNNLQGRIPAELGQLQKWLGCSKTKTTIYVSASLLLNVICTCRCPGPCLCTMCLLLFLN